MQFWATIENDRIIPLDKASAEIFARARKRGGEFQIEIKKPRNVMHHRKFFALIHTILNGLGSNSLTEDNLRQLLAIGAGHVDVIETRKWGQVLLPKSISFAKMDQFEFEQFYDRCLQFIFEEWQIKKQQVRDMVDKFLFPTERR